MIKCVLKYKSIETRCFKHDTAFLGRVITRRKDENLFYNLRFGGEGFQDRPIKLVAFHGPT